MAEEVRSVYALGAAALIAMKQPCTLASGDEHHYPVCGTFARAAFIGDC